MVVAAMAEPQPYSRKDPPEVPVYVLTKGGLVLEEEPHEPPQTRQGRRASPWLWAALILAALAYGLDAGGWVRAAEAGISRRQQRAALAPYRAWAGRNPLSYEDVAFSPGAWAGKAVLWDISRAPDGSYFCGGDAARKVSWTESDAAALSRIPEGGRVRVLARVGNAEERIPVLVLLDLP